MFIYRTYACEGTGDPLHPDGGEPHSFEILIERSEHPNFCPICGTQFTEAPETVPGGFSIGGSAAARAVDSTYALMETSSAERARLAESEGLSPEQARSLKITDMHDNLREGDVAAKLPPLPNNMVGQFMRQAENVGIKYGWGQGNSPGSGVYNGPTSGHYSPGQRVSGPANDALGAVQGAAGTQHQQSKQELASKGEVWAAVGDKRVR